jgi:hypothetical protein
VHGEIAALLLIGIAHIVGLGVLMWALLDGQPSLRGWWPTDGPEDPAPPRPPATPVTVMAMPDLRPRAVRVVAEKNFELYALSAHNSGVRRR